MASETLDGRLGNEGVFGILAIAFLKVDMPRCGEAPFCLEAETGDESRVPWPESGAPDLGDVERTTELEATERAEREYDEDAYDPGDSSRDTVGSGTYNVDVCCLTSCHALLLYTSRLVTFWRCELSRMFSTT